MSLPKLAAKYSISGAINTLVGYALIFGCMALDCGPTLSNVIGYAAGFVLSFVQSRYWVFRSSGSVADDAARFVPAFLVAFAANFLVLQTLIALLVNPYIAQLGSGCAFIGVGFVLNYVFVFRKRKE